MKTVSKTYTQIEKYVFEIEFQTYTDNIEEEFYAFEFPHEWMRLRDDGFISSIYFSPIIYNDTAMVTVTFTREKTEA